MFANTKSKIESKKRFLKAKKSFFNQKLNIFICKLLFAKVIFILNTLHSIWNLENADLETVTFACNIVAQKHSIVL